jgi:hypothetical protein
MTPIPGCGVSHRKKKHDRDSGTRLECEIRQAKINVLLGTDKKNITPFYTNYDNDK